MLNPSPRAAPDRSARDRVGEQADRQCVEIGAIVVEDGAVIVGQKIGGGAGAVRLDQRRRFGIALALVILLILFTLALSIVLRPRHRDAPIELSRVEMQWRGSEQASKTTGFSFEASTTASRTASSRS